MNTYGKARLVVSFVCNHPVYNWPQCFDLKNDPKIILRWICHH